MELDLLKNEKSFAGEHSAFNWIFDSGLYNAENAGGHYLSSGERSPAAEYTSQDSYFAAGDMLEAEPAAFASGAGSVAATELNSGGPNMSGPPYMPGMDGGYDAHMAQPGLYAAPSSRKHNLMDQGYATSVGSVESLDSYGSMGSYGSYASTNSSWIHPGPTSPYTSLSRRGSTGARAIAAQRPASSAVRGGAIKSVEDHGAPLPAYFDEAHASPQIGHAARSGGWVPGPSSGPGSLATPHHQHHVGGSGASSGAGMGDVGGHAPVSVTSLSSAAAPAGGAMKRCPVCQKVLKRDLTRHMRIHEPVAGFVCPFPRDMCTHKRGQFNRPYEYKRHLMCQHFTFDDPAAMLAAPTLLDKLSLTGRCHCGSEVLTADEWMTTHIGGHQCELLVKSEPQQHRQPSHYHQHHQQPHSKHLGKVGQESAATAFGTATTAGGDS